MRTTLTLTLISLLGTASVAQRPPCLPCAGISGADPIAIAQALATAGPIASEQRVYLRFELDATSQPDLAPILTAVKGAGATAWATIRFTVPAPLANGIVELDQQLEVAAAVAAALGTNAHVQVGWSGLEGNSAPPTPEQLADYAFLLKRASVAIAGAAPQARVVTTALPPDVAALRALYASDIAAYVEGVAMAPAPAETIAAMASALVELDPGRPLVVDGVPYPEPADRALLVAAQAATAGASLVFFRDVPAQAEALAPLVRLAAEFAGDVSPDASSNPTGATAYAFVRGDDLSLRVVVDSGGRDTLNLTFADPTLRSVRRLDLQTGERIGEYGLARTPDGLVVSLEGAASTLVLSLERPTAAELEGVEERVDVATDRQMPVEEILRRLQAFEDAQARRLDHYSATNAMTLRFQGGGAGSVETTFEGPFFFQRGQGFDWAWESLYFHGVKWRRDKLPEIPLVQPEKAATLPLEITFTREYTYRLRGEAEIEGRNTWVIDFEPADATVGRDKRLFQGTVWVDRELFARVRTRALQLGLEGDVLSNEETFTFSPVDATGQPAAWVTESFYLPLRVTGQQILNVLNSAVVVEKEQLLTAIAINTADFASRRELVLASDVTMVRDTDAGLRYLVQNEAGTGREVKEGFDANKLFAIGGVFYDESLDFPLPLAGINYFSFDFRGRGQQANAFFAGALLVGNFADPQVGSTRFDAGVDVFAAAIPFGDSVTRDGIEQKGEEVGAIPANIAFNLGHPIGNFVRVGATARAAWRNYQQTDETDDDFVLPSDHFDLSLGLQARFARAGYRITVEGAYHTRSDWEPYGFAEQLAGFDSDTETYATWGITAAKTFSLGGFKRAGFEIGWLDGDNLDRFSKYDFGFFGDARVRGLRSDLVRADEVAFTKSSFGWSIGELLRLDLGLDVAWATEADSGLDNELLAGVGVSGTFPGPWGTFLQADVSKAIEGPDDGFVAYLVFLKLFD